jgi:Flp pilus assembly protein protease CpaA
MADALLFWFLAAYCALACYLDITRRVIPDWLTYGGIAAGLLLGFWNCTVLGPAFAVQYAAMLAVALLLGYALFLLGVWAGGDAKLFWALAALLGAAGRADALLPFALFAAAALLFLAVAFLTSAGTIWGKRIECEKIAFDVAGKAAGSAAVAALFAGLVANDLSLVSVVAVAFLFVRMPKRLWAAVLLAALGLNADAAAVAFPLSFLAAFLAGTAAGIGLKVVAPSLTFRVRIEDLAEGMVPAYTVIERRRKAVIFRPKFSLQSVVAAAKAKGGAKRALQKAGLLPPAGAKIVADSSSAGGIDARQLQRLKKLGNVRWLQVRRTAAFAPVLCACFLAAVAGLL